jgi:alpha-maltose-1-phosphate synthase
VISRNQGSQREREEQDGVEIYRVSEPFNLNAFRKLRNLHENNGSAVVHTHATAGVFLAPFKKALRLPVVSHIHGTTRSAYMPVRLSFGKIVYDYSRFKIAYYYFRERLFWSSSDRILAVSEPIKSDLMSNYKIDEKKIRVVFNGVDTNLFKEIPDPKLPERFGDLDDKKVVLYVGHFGLRKGLLFLIRAMKKVVAEVPDAVLVCVGGVPKWLGGTDYWSYLKNEIQEQNLEKYVFLSDRIPNSELPNFYSRANVFVLPSYYEGFAKVIIEAMACSRPVIVSRKGGPEGIVEEGRSGLLVNYGSVDELANSIIKILEDEPLGRQMGKTGRERVQRDFTWNAVARRIGSVYEEVV